MKALLVALVLGLVLYAISPAHVRLWTDSDQMAPVKGLSM